MPTIQVTINGEIQSIPEGTTVAGLLRDMGKEPRYLAVERNQELVPRVRHAECVLLPQDEIEIVTLVGGG